MTDRKSTIQRFVDAVRPQKHIVEALTHSNAILTTISENILDQRQDYARMKKTIEAMENRLAVIEAGAGHLLENSDWMKTLIDAQSDSMTLIHNFGWIVQNSDKFWRDVLNDVPPELFYSVFNQLDETRQRELMPELFMDGGE